MLHFIIGKPGGGKSYEMARQIAQHLVDHPLQIVVTNSSVRLDELNAYVQRKFPKLDLRVPQRVVIINKSQAFRFWEHREDNLGETSFFGVGYFIDEVHNLFNSRDFARILAERAALSAKAGQDRTKLNGLDLMGYITEHRHLSDTIWMCTHQPAHVDKQLKRLAQDFYSCTNMGNLRIFRWIGFGKFIHINVYEQDPTAERNPFKLETIKYKIDPGGIGLTYDTAGGVNISGPSGADTSLKKKKTLNWKWLLIPFAVACYVFGQLPRWGTNALERTWFPAAKKAVSARIDPTRAISGAIQSGRSIPPAPTGIDNPLGLLAHDTQKPLVITGLIKAGSILRVLVSDGSILKSDEIYQITVDGVRLRSGAFIPYSQELPTPKAQPASKPNDRVGVPLAISPSTVSAEVAPAPASGATAPTQRLTTAPATPTGVAPSAPQSSVRFMMPPNLKH